MPLRYCLQPHNLLVDSISPIEIKERKIIQIGREASKRAGTAGEVGQHKGTWSSLKVCQQTIVTFFGIACG
jgi:hypothetical protein